MQVVLIGREDLGVQLLWSSTALPDIYVVLTSLSTTLQALAARVTLVWVANAINRCY